MIWFHILYKQSYNHGKPGITKLCLTTNKATYFHLSILQTWFNAIQNKTHSFLYLTWMVSVRFRCSVPLWLSNGFYRLQILGFASFYSILSSSNLMDLGLESQHPCLFVSDKISKGSIRSQSNLISDLLSARYAYCIQ